MRDARKTTTNAARPVEPDSMAHFDALPPKVRRALSESSNNWSSTQMLEAWERRCARTGVRGRGSIAMHLVAAVRDNDERQASEYYAALERGSA